MASCDAPEGQDTLRARMRAAYEQVAPRYAEVNAAMPAAVRAAAEQFLAALGSLSDGAHPRVLDLGCGTGRDLAWFGMHAVAGTGLDLSRAMLQEAQRATAATLVQGDMLGLPFRDGAFQGVWCCAALLHLPKRLAPAALAEARRVLQSGGLLFVAVKCGAGERWESESYDLPAPRFFARYRPEELGQLLTDNGFVLGSQGVETTGGTWLHGLASSAGG